MALPSSYAPGIPRVTDMVSRHFQFEGTDSEKYYLKWLESKGVTRDEYMEAAVTFGTAAHKIVEEYVLTGAAEASDSHPYQLASQAFKFLDEYKVKPLGAEVYARYKDSYQGTCDLLAMVDGKRTIIDWKTWGAAKRKFGMDETRRAPGDKLAKASLQLSLYAMALRATRCIVVELTPDRYYAHEVPRITNQTLKLLIK